MTIVRDVVRSSRRSLIGWGIALAAVTSLYTSLYPTIGSVDFEAMIDAFPEALVEALDYDQIATAAGYITSTVYALLGTVLLSVFGIGLGARLIAGREEDGTLELEYTAPVPRRRVYLERLAALWIELSLLALWVSLVVYFWVLVLSLEVEVVNLVAVTAGMLLFLGGLGTLALAVGAITGRRAIALGVAAGLAVAAYMLNAIGPTVDAPWMEMISPFAWFVGDQPLANGFDWAGLGLLALIPLFAGPVGLWVFQRRDLMV
jgi:ABC-2 type transport system permease protein